MTVPDQSLAARNIGLVNVGGNKRVSLSLYGLRKQLARSLTQVRQRVR